MNETMSFNMNMNMSMAMDNKNIMPETDILDDESNLPAQFVAAKRITIKDYTKKPDDFRSLVHDYCIRKGKPLVISDMQTMRGWNDATFSLDQLKEYRGDFISALDFPDNQKKEVVLGQFIEKLQQENRLDSSHSYKPLRDSSKRVYAKDISCPEEYGGTMKKIIPDYLLPHGPDDLFSILPRRFRAENLMCYLGQDNTGTPVHRDLCGTMGHNLMTMGNPDSFAEWIIIEHEHRDKLAAILRPSQTEDLVVDLSTQPKYTKSSFMESDRAWLQNSMLENASFQAQVIVQRPGDLVIIPSRAYHQVRNVGISIKIAWNRITAQTLQYAFEDQIPLYQTIIRPEVYKCKAIVSLTLHNWNKQLKLLKARKTKDTKFYKRHGFYLKTNRAAFFENSRILLDLFLTNVIAPELLYNDNKGIVRDSKEEVFTVRCDFCYGDVFHRYYHCEICNKYDLCLNCYSMGRSCEHVTGMKMHQSPKHLTMYIRLYKDYVSNLNKVIGSSLNYYLEENKEKPLLELTQSEASNLATTCRRLERFRSRMKSHFNILKCQHCGSTTTVSELGNQGISLASVFKRGLCSKVEAKSDRQDVNVFTCIECTAKCDQCLPLENANESLKDYDLVYYLHPTHDPRNWGCFIDFNVQKTCDLETQAPPTPTPTPSPNLASKPKSTTKRKQRDESDDTDTQEKETGTSKRRRNSKAEELF
ncbi:hypothetical protein [Parasitella parasitica]|uniref:JmjC domain-containing protein n=1 Tax=Parasitella parasitica TaxID=35722 RepID=A0A0B7NTC4_9FUNG|nr:hypothetical protein [Parasitella parasitica]